MIESNGVPKKQNMFGCETFEREQKQSTKSLTYIYYGYRSMLHTKTCLVLSKYIPK